ncbi:MAG: ORF6N domain-containing protein, partial [Blastocatellia bacterium]
ILYGVPTKALNQAVRRNLERFPGDSMFQLTGDEVELLRSQIVTSNTGRGGRRYQPLVFTEQRHRDVIDGPQERSRYSGQHRHNACLRQNAVRPRGKQGTGQASRKTRKNHDPLNFAAIYKFIDDYRKTKRQLPSAIGFRHPPTKK